MKSDLTIFDRMESEVRGYIRSFPVVFKRAQGSVLTDEADKEYIDFFSGAGTLNYGHNNPVFKQSLIDYLNSDGVVHGLDMATTAKKAFLETVDELLLKPRNMEYVLQFTGPTGTNAVEAALKVARQVKQRQNVIAFTHGFHGVSGGSLAVTANSKFRDAAGVALSNVTFVPYDGYFGADVDTMTWLERMLEDNSSGMDLPAAVIVETVQGEGGVNVASNRWLKKLAALCRQFDMLLIVDDIQVGCGRTGNFFSFEEAGIQPDIITLSKSLSGYGLPMSLVLIRPELDIWQPGAHSGTFRGNNMAFVTATQALRTYWADDQLANDTKRKGELVSQRLQAMARNYPAAGLRVRGRGLIQGLSSTSHPQVAGLISAKAFEHGLIIETSGARDEVLKLLPALTTTDEQLLQGLDIIERSLEEVLIEEGIKTRILKFGGAGR
ncbi:MAG TPA: diaminobutyrate--2-oxoglutarate transaminase [Burkholderiaceae bacterium]|nr:diaminobutyrate--2-oxoglutarate transaminase [Burkholderiaceae bacterium]